MTRKVDPKREELRQAMTEGVMEKKAKLPTSTLGRVGRSALIALRTGRLIRKGRKKKPDAPANVEQLLKLVTSLGQLKGIAMKMGQIMSYIDVALPDELRAALSALQTSAPPMDFDELTKQIRQSLGEKAEDVLAPMDPKPVAAASIGQVHKSRLPDGRVVAIKVQYPEMERAILADFKPAAVGTKLARLLVPGARVDGFIEEAKARFLEECDYLHEARAQQRFFDLYSEHPILSVPEVIHEYSGREVLCTAWIDGLGLDAFLATEPEQAIRDKMGVALFDFYLGSLFIHGLYNCDPHPGNYLFLPGGRLALLDHGCTRSFPPSFVDELAKMGLAVHADDRDTLLASFNRLGLLRKDREEDFQIARRLVRAFQGPMLDDKEQIISEDAALELGQLMRAKKQLLKLNFPGEFLFLSRIRFGLMSVLARLGASANWHRLEKAYMEQAVESE